ncbi:SDR family NAD(P)-dependent oxidoreductase [Nocardia fluminea]|uniref:NAD(P)-dependent dehydrogenase (Short-subunit alcohol dehydrogenase family) n=1 Tax=Nocardia fluminea TaxID=134984 RepID=A0A2N3VIS0_9NOCA|nr:SDR family NAD(P)-dependent oxidoreductase [Nocardia fluminea]PKV81485.1 NAD(P)-dependent dehydrogenase (short-subunit alcohol dehydrogenase family) [Nocardia fluminea]
MSTPTNDGSQAQPLSIVTGGTDGIGKEVARELARQGKRVWIIGRNEAKGAAAEAELRQAGDVRFVAADLGVMAQVRALSDKILAETDEVESLVHSAGILKIEHALNSDGIEQNFAINYLGRFLLTERLLPALTKGRARVVDIAAAGMNKMVFDLDSLPGIPELSPFKTFTPSQAANDVWVQDLAARVEGTGVVVTGVMPGMVETDIRLNDANGFLIKLTDSPLLKPLLRKFILISPATAAITPVWLATDPPASANGGFFGPKKKVITVKPDPEDPALQQKLRETSLRLVGGAL